MNKKEDKLVKNTLLFSIGNVGSKLLMLLIIPLYTYYVSVDQMGKFDVVNTYINLFAPIACISIYDSIYRWLLDDVERSNTIKSGYLIAGISVFLFITIAAIYLWDIKYEFLFEFLLLIFTQSFYLLMQFTTRGLRHNKLYAIQGIVYAIMLVICNFILVIWLRMQAQGLLLSIIIAEGMTAIYLFAVQRIGAKYICNVNVNLKLMKDMIGYSIPMVPNNVAWWIVSGSSRILINFSLGNVANGIYAIAFKFPTVINMLSTFFNQAWQEQAITEYYSEERDQYYTKIFNIYLKLMLTSTVVLLPVSKFIISFLMNQAYAESCKYIGILYLGSVFNAMAAFYGTGYLCAKKTTGALTTTLGGTIINIVIILLFVKQWGLYAAALGNLFGNFTIWISRTIQTRKYFHISVKKVMAIKYIVIDIVFTFLINYVELSGMIVLQVVSIIIFVFANKQLINKMLEFFKYRKDR